MKKIVTMILVALLALAMAACSDDGKNSNNNDGTDGNGNHLGNLDVPDSCLVLNNIWEGYDEEQLFSAVGGDLSEENMTMDAPGRFNLGDPELVDNTLGFPAGKVDKIDDAASIMHMMNANTFTAGVYHVIESSDITALAEELKTNLEGRQWICGAPDKLIIAEVDGYLISCFGALDLVEDFVDNLETVYDTAEVIYNIDLIF